MVRFLAQRWTRGRPYPIHRCVEPDPDTTNAQRPSFPNRWPHKRVQPQRSPSYANWVSDSFVESSGTPNRTPIRIPVPHLIPRAANRLELHDPEVSHRFTLRRLDHQPEPTTKGAVQGDNMSRGANEVFLQKTGHKGCFHSCPLGRHLPRNRRPGQRRYRNYYRPRAAERPKRFDAFHQGDVPRPGFDL